MKTETISITVGVDVENEAELGKRIDEIRIVRVEHVARKARSRRREARTTQPTHHTALPQTGREARLSTGKQ